MKEKTFTLNVIDGVGNVLDSEVIAAPAGMLERVEALKQAWAEAQSVQVCVNGAALFSIDVKGR